uniref:Uncharacterized protein n=1 Tax=Glossina morsitans morsitans TaxID=37546 RepID=A0A1B0GE39_GLOMM
MTEIKQEAEETKATPVPVRRSMRIREQATESSASKRRKVLQAENGEVKTKYRKPHRRTLNPAKLEELRNRELEYKRQYRASLSGPALAAYRFRNAELKRRYRASLSPSKLLEYRYKEAARKRRYRASLSEDVLMQIRFKNAERKRLQRLGRKLELEERHLLRKRSGNDRSRILEPEIKIEELSIDIPRKSQFAKAMKGNTKSDDNE